MTSGRQGASINGVGKDHPTKAAVPRTRDRPAIRARTWSKSLTYSAPVSSSLRPFDTTLLFVHDRGTTRRVAQAPGVGHRCKTEKLKKMRH